MVTHFKEGKGKQLPLSLLFQQYYETKRGNVMEIEEWVISVPSLPYLAISDFSNPQATGDIR